MAAEMDIDTDMLIVNVTAKEYFKFGDRAEKNLKALLAPCTDKVNSAMFPGEIPESRWKRTDDIKIVGAHLLLYALKDYNQVY